MERPQIPPIVSQGVQFWLANRFRQWSGCSPPSFGTRIAAATAIYRGRPPALTNALPNSSPPLTNGWQHVALPTPRRERRSLHEWPVGCFASNGQPRAENPARPFFDTIRPEFAAQRKLRVARHPLIFAIASPASGGNASIDHKRKLQFRAGGPLQMATKYVSSGTTERRQ